MRAKAQGGFVVSININDSVLGLNCLVFEGRLRHYMALIGVGIVDDNNSQLDDF